MVVGNDGMSAIHDRSVISFASDNYAGALPEVMDAIAAANGGHQGAYSADDYTAALRTWTKTEFGEAADIFPVFNGTGANVVALHAMSPVWGAVVCAASAHIMTDEGGAPEKMASLKLLPVSGEGGKLTPALVDREAHGYGDPHRAQPVVLSISNATEFGTVYSPDELRVLIDHAHELGMRVHLDGARIANAAAHLGVPLSALTRDVGVDVLSLGGTKNGMLFGEAVVVLNPEAAPGVEYVRKLDGQLASKMRFISAQLLALYDGDLGLRTARHANAMAARLADGVQDVPGVEIAFPVQSNAVFARMDPAAADRARESFAFYSWPTEPGLQRWVCAFDTQPEQVDSFVAAIRGAVS